MIVMTMTMTFGEPVHLQWFEISAWPVHNPLGSNQKLVSCMALSTLCHASLTAVVTTTETLLPL